MMTFLPSSDRLAPLGVSRHGKTSGPPCQAEPGNGSWSFNVNFLRTTAWHQKQQGPSVRKTGNPLANQVTLIQHNATKQKK
jgi:hypothetical protein